MIDFNAGEEKLNKFSGSEKKTTILYNNELYMIKFPDPIRDKKNVLSYMNNQYSEHIGCNIFRACGFVTQETALGTYTDKTGKEKIVVGCKDFTQNGAILHEFSKLGNQIVEIDSKFGTTIENVGLIIDKCDLIKNKRDMLDGFWNMFVIDALLGNSDRHFDNWGVLEQNGQILFAPIYDCGSTLGALLDDSTMGELLTDANLPEFKNREYNITSCYYMESKRIFYHEIFKNPPNDLAKAAKRTISKIHINKINSIVDSTEQISNIRKEYLRKAIAIRHEQILIPALKRILQH
ncbi:MAG: HipA domain-containing protein [Oscillospiraceae bacterium]|nr:HipA domain-containing protein [Oscillospiraceae bacterium]